MIDEEKLQRDIDELARIWCDPPQRPTLTIIKGGKA